MNKQTRAFVAFLLLGLVYVSFLTVRYFAIQLPPNYWYKPWIVGTAYPPGELEEVITIPVNSKQDITTRRQYAGSVTIRVRGEGEVTAGIKHDALYTYTNSARVQRRFYNFYLDNGPLDYRVKFGNTPPIGELPIFDAVHEYKFLYWVGSEVRPIAFRIENGNTQDSSIFSATISIENLIDAAGR